MAMIDHFRERGAMVVATTHYDALKTYASTTEGVTPAGFGFDPETFAPTYRLNYGSPGSSLALEIATRLGLPAVDHRAARARTAASGRRSSPITWREVERDLQSLEHERRLAARERQRSTRPRRNCRRASRNSATAKRRSASASIERDRRAAARSAPRDRRRRRGAEGEDRHDGGGRRAPLGAAAASPPARPAQRAPRRARRVDAIEEASRCIDRSRGCPAAAVGAPDAPGEPPAASGTASSLARSASRASCRSVHGRDAEVDVRGKRLRARIDDLRVVPAAPRAAAGHGPRQRRAAAARGLAHRTERHRLQRRRSAVRAEKFLDEALITEHEDAAD